MDRYVSVHWICIYVNTQATQPVSHLYLFHTVRCFVTPGLNPHVCSNEEKKMSSTTSYSNIILCSLCKRILLGPLLPSLMFLSMCHTSACLVCSESPLKGPQQHRLTSRGHQKHLRSDWQQESFNWNCLPTFSCDMCVRSKAENVIALKLCPYQHLVQPAHREKVVMYPVTYCSVSKATLLLF